MNKNIQDTKINKPDASDSMFKTPVSSDNLFTFQIFFLAQNQSQDVEIVETEEINFREITQRLKLGESVFIKQKNQEFLKLQSSEEGKYSSWYFNRC